MRRNKCFVPECRNSSTRTRDKVFVHVNDYLKWKWCRQLNVVFNPHQRLYCCEDHLDLKEDLENYYQWKLMKARPKLKHTAIFKYSKDIKSSKTPYAPEEEVIDNEPTTSELEKLLRMSAEDILKINNSPKISATCTNPKN